MMWILLVEGGTWNFVPFDAVKGFILGLPYAVPKQIRDKFVIIDFRNEDPMHFFKYIAGGMARNLL